MTVRLSSRLRGTGVPWPSISLLLLVLLAAIGGESLAPHDPNGLDLAAAFRPPAWAEKGSISYLLGTDNLGRDIFSRIIAGARVSLVSAAYAITIAGAIGGLIGMISGFFGGWVDALIMRLVDIQMSIPALALALVIAAVFGADFTTVAIVIVVTSGPGMPASCAARSCRSKSATTWPWPGWPAATPPPSLPATCCPTS